MSIYKGSGVALVTPFDDNLEIDYARLEKLIEFQIENKTDALIICGTTGEAATMTREEQIEVVKFAVKKANGRVPIIAGAGGNNTKNVVEISKAMEDVGADALLSVTPYYNKATDDGLVNHYHKQADSVSIPIIVYNVPGRTGLNIKVHVLKRIAEHKNIVGIKEASGSIVQAMEIRKNCPDLDIYSGNDDINIPLMAVGAVGVISVLANVLPNETSKMCKLKLDGKLDEAMELQIKYLDLIKKLFQETNPVPVKACMELLGLLDNGLLRLPLSKAKESTYKSLREELEKLELI